MKSSKSETGWTLTAYCGCMKCCGKEDNISASGKQLTSSDIMKVCAAPSSFPFGTKITISGGWSGTVTVEDRGGAIKGKRLDIYMGDKTHHQDALYFGKKTGCTIQY